MLKNAQLLLGKTLGACKLEQLIGLGGMGAVYLARQQRPSRSVAVKVLLPDFNDDENAHQHYLARFRREADIIASLEHVNIVPIYEYGEQDGLAYLTMPYLRGSLHGLLRQHGALDLSKTLEYMQQAASALDYAHAHAVIHRDLKPANFLLHSDGRLLLSDFGIARLLEGGSNPQDSQLTRAGALLGTPAYMSPEMLRGETIDYRADLYAFGIVLYELLSGQLPFQGDPPYVIITKHLQEAPPSLHAINQAIPPSVDAILQRALAKRREERFQTATALVQALAEAANTLLISENDAPTLLPTLPPPVPGTPARQSQRPLTAGTLQQGTQSTEERRLVTILSTDAIEAALSDDPIDSEDMTALIEHYQELVRRVGAQHGAGMEKLVGDALLLIFGLPLTQGDEAERALNCALEIQSEALNDPLLKGRLQPRMVVDTGEVVARYATDTGEVSVSGEVVRLANRVQQMAQAGEILVSERTAQAAQATFVFGEERKIAIKGLKQPFSVVGLLAVRPTRQVGHPKLVGRKRDLLQLDLLKMRVLEERRPQLVSIVAPAGTGKSRLLDEFLARLDAQDGFRVVTARCFPFVQNLYMPLQDMLAEILQGEISKERLSPLFMRSGHTPADAARLADYILSTMGMAAAEGNVERESSATAWRLLLESLARQGPLIVVFEDLHWASDNLLALVEQMMHSRTQVPLMIVVLSRPELLDRRPAWGGGQQNFTMLALDALNETQIEELIAQSMEDLPASARLQIAERSGGNPFFAIELIRVVVERGAQLQSALPDTVHAAILARLDLLPALQRKVIQSASVMERAFRALILSALLENVPPAEIEGSLDELAARNFLVVNDEGRYTFRHVLIRDVAYGTLARQERIRLHSGVAAWMETGTDERNDEFIEVVAYHYREAVALARQSAVPLALPFDVLHVVPYFERAAAVASNAGEFIMAWNYMQSAIDIAAASDRGWLYERQGDYMVIGDRAIQAYQAALSCWRASAERQADDGARLLRKSLMVYLRQGVSAAQHLSDASLAQLEQEALQLAGEMADDYEIWRIRVLRVWAIFYRESGFQLEELLASRATALEAAAYFEARQDWDALSEAFDGYSFLSVVIGAYQEALDVLKRRLAIPGLRASEYGDAIGMLSLAYLLLGDFAQSISTVRDALAALRPGDPTLPFSTALGWAIQAAYVTGRWSEADQLLPTVHALWSQVGHDHSIKALLTSSYLSLLSIALAREDQEEGNANLLILYDILTEQMAGQRSFISALVADQEAPVDLSWVTVRAPFWAVLAFLFMNERGLAAPPMLIVQGRMISSTDNLLLRLIEINEAISAGNTEQLAAAIDQAETYGLRPHAARMRIVLAQRLGNPILLEQVRPVLEEFGDHRTLRRLEKVQIVLNGAKE